MDKTLQKIKVNILKKMIGKRVFVITNPLLEEGYCAVVNKIIDHETVSIINEKQESNINIFDIRTPSRLYNCE